MFPQSSSVKHNKVQQLHYRSWCTGNLQSGKVQDINQEQIQLQKKSATVFPFPGTHCKIQQKSQLVLLVESPAPQQQKNRPDKSSPHYDLSPLAHSYAPWGLKDAKFFTGTRGCMVQGQEMWSLCWRRAKEKKSQLTGSCKAPPTSPGISLWWLL